MLVTDIIRKFKNKTIKQGYYMDGYLKENLDGIPNYLSKGWDVVGIVSGHGKVRMGKSTMAFQVGYYIAWLLAGGRIITKPNEYTKQREFVQMIKPTRDVNFSLHENIVFKPEDLVERAKMLHKKYNPKEGKDGKPNVGSVIIYDEGREGLDSKVMDSINGVMEDFFQKCGYMGHVILLVLPNFFKLHEDYAVSRSLFLIDCFADKQKRRGYFNFYDEVQKEWLYFLGKKRIGITQKYSAAHESFWGRYPAWFPFNKKEYDELKEKSIGKASITKQAKRWKRVRDVLVYLLKKETDLDNITIAKKVTDLAGIIYSDSSVKYAIEKIETELERAS